MKKEYCSHKAFAFILIFLLCTSCVSLGAYSESGEASWYGGKFQGRQTASGEIFDTNKLTAAHKTLAFGTLVEVVSLENGRKVVVRVNDRGPYVDGRIIDLSRAAADSLDMVSSGVIRVAIRVVQTPENPGLEHRVVPEEGTVILQIGSYGVRDNAQNTKMLLNKEGFEAELEGTANGITRVVLAGVEESELQSVLRKLARLGFSKPLIRRTR